MIGKPGRQTADRDAQMLEAYQHHLAEGRSAEEAKGLVASRWNLRQVYAGQILREEERRQAMVKEYHRIHRGLTKEAHDGE